MPRWRPTRWRCNSAAHLRFLKGDPERRRGLLTGRPLRHTRWQVDRWKCVARVGALRVIDVHPGSVTVSGAPRSSLATNPAATIEVADPNLTVPGASGAVAGTLLTRFRVSAASQRALSVGIGAEGVGSAAGAGTIWATRRRMISTAWARSSGSAVASVGAVTTSQ